MHGRMVTSSKVSRLGVHCIINSLQNNIEDTTVSLYSLGHLK